MKIHINTMFDPIVEMCQMKMLLRGEKYLHEDPMQLGFVTLYNRLLDEMKELDKSETDENDIEELIDIINSTAFLLCHRMGGTSFERKFSHRTNEFQLFASTVKKHILEYTIPQYGEHPDDNVSSWSQADCIKQIEKYCKRFSGNARGHEDNILSLLKIAHYACIAYFKETPQCGITE